MTKCEKVVSNKKNPVALETPVVTISNSQLFEMFPALSSLRASASLSHTRERRRVKQSGGKESGEETPRKWACPDLCNFFISALSERSEIPLVKRQENCQSIMFDEERLNPCGVRR